MRFIILEVEKELHCRFLCDGLYKLGVSSPTQALNSMLVIQKKKKKFKSSYIFIYMIYIYSYLIVECCRVHKVEKVKGHKSLVCSAGAAHSHLMSPTSYWLLSKQTVV